jgi:response regulator of citrate/malate metabolism
MRPLLEEKIEMLARTILTIASDDLLLQMLRWQLQDHEDGANRMVVASTIDEACSLIRTVRPRLIVVHLDRGGRYDDVNRLLWTTTVLAHPVPVLVIADWYRVEQATRLFRMGVTDYISRSHHQPHLGRVLDAYLRTGLIDRPDTSWSAHRHGQQLESSSRTSRAIRARVG